MTQVYRHYDKDGNLLYVGISLNAINRTAQHERTATWFDRVCRIDIQNFSTREQAIIAERTAIQDEKPLYNITHANPRETISKLIDAIETKIISTYEFAERVKVKPASIRSAICRDGHYLGIVPNKLPNRRLVWPAEAVARVLMLGVS